jgi:hypothetical protein
VLRVGDYGLCPLLGLPTVMEVVMYCPDFLFRTEGILPLVFTGC